MATAESSYTREQVSVWLRGLLSVAWADGHFDEEEKQLINEMTQDELAPNIDFETFRPISSQELGQALTPKSDTAEDY